MTDKRSVLPLLSGLHRIRNLLGVLQYQLELACDEGQATDVTMLTTLRAAISELTVVEDFALGQARTVAPQSRESDVVSGRRHVLVLEDDAAGCYLLITRLRRLGFEAEEQRGSLPEPNGHTSLIVDLSAVDSLSPDQVAVVREYRPIVLTGAVGLRANAWVGNLDAFDWLTKPVNVDRIAAAINRQAEGSS